MPSGADTRFELRLLFKEVQRPLVEKPFSQSRPEHSCVALAQDNVPFVGVHDAAVRTDRNERDSARLEQLAEVRARDADDAARLLRGQHPAGRNKRDGLA